MRSSTGASATLSVEALGQRRILLTNVPPLYWIWDQVYSARKLDYDRTHTETTSNVFRWQCKYNSWSLLSWWWTAHENTLQNWWLSIGIIQPEKFRAATRTHLIAWRNYLTEKALCDMTILYCYAGLQFDEFVPSGHVLCQSWLHYPWRTEKNHKPGRCYTATWMNRRVLE